MREDVYEANVHHGKKNIDIASIRALLKDGIIKANLIPAFAAGFLAVMIHGLSFFENIITLLVMVVGTMLVIGGVCAINNYYDRDIDSVMKSKQNRPSIDGTFTGQQILAIGFSLTIIGLVLLFFINITTGILGLLAAFGYVVLYSIYTKRHYVSNTVIGALPGSMPPLIGWAAIDPSIHILPIAMFLMMFAWQPPHFYALAIKRSDEYSLAGVPMLPSVKGNARTQKSIVMWIVILALTPLLMFKLGIWFVVLTTILNIVWLYIALNGFKTVENYNKYAMKVFIFSLNYIIIFFVMMIVAALLI
ncbi:heme o synthase [Aliicoccus persicus]|uniref:Protoheme IX farnesyltransferase n=1 Tax=Aliicoccus persicus TaxID=930138 RepID=A0A662Z1Z8_9STAP|nr:heme o synthase [Aliicoccus persicus]SEV80355.1 protoheme IX farnesyltransferase [Aliicoccus persicus]